MPAALVLAGQTGTGGDVRYWRMFTARATTMIASSMLAADCTIIRTFAHWLSGTQHSPLWGLRNTMRSTITDFEPPRLLGADVVGDLRGRGL